MLGILEASASNTESDSGYPENVFRSFTLAPSLPGRVSHLNYVMTTKKFIARNNFVSECMKLLLRTVQ